MSSRPPPVSYHRDWLYAYRPNKTFYLSAEIRAMAAAAEFHASIACHALNLLLRASLCPTTFATVTGRDLDGVLTRWDLNRAELLAKFFARAYADFHTRNGSSE